MPLESLLTQIETLKKRIQDHCAALVLSATLTRHALHALIDRESR